MDQYHPKLRYPKTQRDPIVSSFNRYGKCWVSGIWKQILQGVVVRFRLSVWMKPKCLTAKIALFWCCSSDCSSEKSYFKKQQYNVSKCTTAAVHVISYVWGEIKRWIKKAVVQKSGSKLERIPGTRCWLFWLTVCRQSLAGRMQFQ